jgi:hypothetical protein
MRKFGFAVALAAAALFAQGVRADSAGDKAKNAGSAASGEARKTGERWEEAADRAAGSSDSSVDAKVFDGKTNFDVDGKIQKVSKSSITIARDGLPPATLGLAKGAKVQLDGNDVSISQLKPGEDVKASFNLDRDHPAAVEIKAKQNK